MTSRVPLAGLCALLLLVAGCAGSPGATTPSTTDATTTTTTQPTETEAPTRFDGEANAELSIYNPTNGTWNATVTVERNGTVVVNTSEPVPAGSMWTAGTFEQPGNYTFTVATGSWQDTVSVRLPRAVGDRRTFIEVTDAGGEFGLRVRWEQ